MNFSLARFEKARNSKIPLKCGPFEVDRRSVTLMRDGALVAAPKLPVRLLVILLDRAGEVVTRDELKTMLWADRVREFDTGINTAVAQLRKALGDNASKPRFIETIPGRGYRFMAPAEAPTSSSLIRRRWPSFGGTLVLAALLVTVALMPEQPARVAIELPQPRSGDGAANLGADSDRLAQALAESLVRELARFTQAHLTVQSSPNAGHDYLLAGRFVEDGPVIEYHATLVRQEDQRVLWGERFRLERDRLRTDPADEARKIAYAVFTVLSDR